MRILPSLTIRILFGSTLVGAVVVVVLNQNAISRLRLENQTLLAERQEAESLRLENQDIPRLRQESQEAEKLRQDNQELPKLRNDVRQLRRQKEELERLRAENNRLRSSQATAGSQAASMPPDFIPKSALGDAGLGSPEATVQTFFWAMCQGNLDRLTQCMLAGRTALNPGRQQDLESKRRQIVEGMSSFAGFRIAERQDISEDEVVLSLQSAVGGTVMPMKLKRVRTEWKLDQ
jgi:TolA-binding protein